MSLVFQWDSQKEAIKSNEIMSNNLETEDLLPEYNFDYPKSKPNRFSGRGRVVVTLEDDVLVYLQARADEKGRKLGDMVNELLKREIDLIEAVK